MLIEKKRKNDVCSSDITTESVFYSRRQILKASSLAGLSLTSTQAFSMTNDAQATGKKLDGLRETAYGKGQKINSFKDITSYNNFYEFGTGKNDPVERAHTLKTEPWHIEVSGDCEKPGRYLLQDVINFNDLEERIYRFRCVEAWSMVIPWVGYPLAKVISKFQPLASAKYVSFKTLFDPEQMPGQKSPFIDWPYVEGLRMDEAMNELSLLSVGVYGRVLPNQNGAPVRLIVPWKYGFKSIKSIVNIHFSSNEPKTTWNILAPNEYGFYANVNPEVAHPRWIQARERRIDSSGGVLNSLFQAKQDTLMFNGYSEQVASLYQGLDLRKNF